MLEAKRIFGGIYEGRRVLVTGHTGFKGSWLSLWLHYLGASVVGYSLQPPSQPNLFEDLRLQDKIVHIFGDVRDFDHLQTTFDKYQPEIVLHLAAQSLVRYSYTEPLLTYETNVMGTANVLEAVINCASVRVVINVTSDKCYENKEWDYAYRENDPMGGTDPYSSSKGCAELVASAYYNSFLKKESNVRLASVRAGNVIGGGDWATDRLVPDCIRALQRNERIIIRNPHGVRPWQHVLEPLSGYLWLTSQMWLSNHEFDGAWNFGPLSKSNTPVKQVVELVINEWGDGSWYEPEGSIAQPHEARFLKLDCTKANNQLDWYPVYDIERSVQVTTAWYKSYNRKEKRALETTLNDIEMYTDEAKRKQLAWALT